MNNIFQNKDKLNSIDVMSFIIGFFIICSLFSVFTCSGNKSGSSLLSKTCAGCHGDEPEYPLLGARAGYDTSGHKNLGNSYYANGDSCQKCHTNEGFIEFVASGSLDAHPFVSSPSQVGCFTCHSPHETGDFSLITDLGIITSSGKVFDRGKGNLCAHCHQATSNSKDTVRPMPANKVMPYWGPHHGPQADMFIGTGAYQYEGKTYSNSIHSKIIQDSCVVCHATLPDKRYGLTPAIGGHSFNMAGDVHHTPHLNTAGCLLCHQEIEQKVVQVNGGRKAVFDIKAREDYDQDNVVETIQEEVTGLLGKLVNSNGTGYLQRLDIPFFNERGDFAMTGNDAQRSETEMAALFNYKFVLEDRSDGIHNSQYAIQILYDTIKSLDPAFNTTARPE